MITVRKSQERGAANHGWLDTKHSFSFAHYYDPTHMGFGPLRVINEDRIIPGAGFPTHGHEDMEIVTYVIDGALEHKDSMGNGSIIQPGDVQRMTAGTGVQHSEFNASDNASVHLLQIWILPNKDGLQPSYEQITFPDETKRGRLRLIGSQDGRDGSVTIHQSVDLFASKLETGSELEHNLENGPAWLQLISGSLTVNDVSLTAGDGAGVTEEQRLRISTTQDAEFLLFHFGA